MKIQNCRRDKKMKYLLIILLLITIYSPNILGSAELNLSEKEKLMNRYSWMTENLYKLYKKRSIKYNVPIKLAISVVNAESNGRIVISRKNKNGTRDYGRFQINSLHMKNNPKSLLQDSINSKYGFWYLFLCLKKAKGDLIDTVRMYNQGSNGKAHKYKNWEYVIKVLKEYKRI
jgi:hypothetical protein